MRSIRRSISSAWAVASAGRAVEIIYQPSAMVAGVYEQRHHTPTSLHFHNYCSSAAAPAGAEGGSRADDVVLGLLKSNLKSMESILRLHSTPSASFESKAVQTLVSALQSQVKSLDAITNSDHVPSAEVRSRANDPLILIRVLESHCKSMEAAMLYFQCGTSAEERSGVLDRLSRALGSHAESLIAMSSAEIGDYFPFMRQPAPENNTILLSENTVVGGFGNIVKILASVKGEVSDRIMTLNVEITNLKKREDTLFVCSVDHAQEIKFDLVESRDISIRNVSKEEAKDVYSPVLSFLGLDQKLVNILWREIFMKELVVEEAAN